VQEVRDIVSSGGEKRCCVEVDRGSGFGLVGDSRSTQCSVDAKEVRWV